MDVDNLDIPKFFDLRAELRNPIYDRLFVHTSLKYTDGDVLPTISTIESYAKASTISRRFAQEYAARVRQFQRLIIDHRSLHCFSLHIPDYLQSTYSNLDVHFRSHDAPGRTAIACGPAH